MKSILLILLCSVSLSLSVSAQEKLYKKDNKDKMERFMPMMTRGIGISFQNFDGLNNRIAGFPQYKTVKDHMWTISAGSMHVIKNFVSQLTLTGGSSLTGNPDKMSSTMRFVSGGLDFGYDVIPADKVMLYPLVGIGAECYHAIFYKDVSAVDFDDVANSSTLQNSIRKVKFVNSFVTYRFGLGIAFKSPKNAATVGLQAGYTGGFKEKDWKSAEYQSLDGAPSDRLSRFNVSLVFTGPSMMSHMMKK